MEIKVLYKGCEISSDRLLKHFKTFKQSEKLIHLIPIVNVDESPAIKMAKLVDMNVEDGIMVVRFN